MDGKNIFDYVDPDIERKLQLLEEEQANFVLPEEELLNDKELFENEVLEQVRDSVYVNRVSSKLENNRSVSKGRISIGDLKKKIEQKGLDSAKSVQRAQDKIQKQTFRDMRNQSGMEIEEDGDDKMTLRQFNNKPDQLAEKRRRKIQKKDYKQGQKGEGDRHVYNLRPKHLLSGKTSIGTRDRR
jgi:nucleolar GTP-binding protein